MSRVQGVEGHVIDGVLHVKIPDTAVGDEDAPIKAFAFHFPAGVKRLHLAKTIDHVGRGSVSKCFVSSTVLHPFCTVLGLVCMYRYVPAQMEAAAKG